MMKKWEYKHVNVRAEIDHDALEDYVQQEELFKEYLIRLDAILNRYGADGWEIVKVDDSSGWVLFKRPVDESQFSMPTVPDDPVHQVTQ